MWFFTPFILTEAALLCCFLLWIPLQDLKPSIQLYDHFSSVISANIGIWCHSWVAAAHIRLPVIGMQEFYRHWCHLKRAFSKRGCLATLFCSYMPCLCGNLTILSCWNLLLSISDIKDWLILWQRKLLAQQASSCCNRLGCFWWWAQIFWRS